MATTMEIGKKLVDLCRQGKAMEAITTLYSPNIVSLEATSSPAMPAPNGGSGCDQGKDRMVEKNHEVHKAEVEGPWPHGDRFIVRFKFDVPPRPVPWPANAW